MSDEKTSAESYVVGAPRSKRRRLRRLPPSHGGRIPELDQKLRSKRARRRVRRLRKRTARRPLGSRPAPAQASAVGGKRARRQRRPRSRETRRVRPPTPVLRPPPEPDPLFDSARLTVELVPRPLWYKSNIRTVLPREDWDLLRRSVYRRANYLCEICGGRGPAHPIECHEVWQYDEAARTQTLKRMIGLCPACHGVKHKGRSQIVGKGDEAMTHLAAVNGWPSDLAQRYVDLAFHVWARRSGLSGWRLLVNWDVIAADYGVALSFHGSSDYPAEATGAGHMS